MIEFSSVSMPITAPGADETLRLLLLLDQRGQQAANRTAAISTASTHAHLSTGRLSHELLNLTREALNVNPAVAQMGNMLGQLSVGAPLMIGVLAGIAALGYAWDHVSKAAKTAKEEQDTAIKALDTVRDKGRNPIYGDVPHQRELAIQRQQDLEKELAMAKAIAAMQVSDASKQVFSKLHDVRSVTDVTRDLANVTNLIQWSDREMARLRAEENEPTRKAGLTATQNERELVIMRDRIEHRRDEYQLALAANGAELTAKEAQIRESFRQIDVDGKAKVLTTEQIAAQDKLLEQAREMAHLKGEELANTLSLAIQEKNAAGLAASDNAAEAFRGRLQQIDLEMKAEIKAGNDVVLATRNAEIKKRALYKETADQISGYLNSIIQATVNGGLAGGIGGAVEAFGRSALKGLGEFIQQFGEKALASAVLMKIFKEGFSLLNPELSIQAATGMIALGTALIAGADAGRGGGSTGVGAASMTAGAANYGAMAVAPYSSGYAPNMQGLKAASPVIVQATFIGKHDAKAARELSEMIDYHQRRRS